MAFARVCADVHVCVHGLLAKTRLTTQTESVADQFGPIMFGSHYPALIWPKNLGLSTWGRTNTADHMEWLHCSASAPVTGDWSPCLHSSEFPSLQQQSPDLGPHGEDLTTLTPGHCPHPRQRLQQSTDNQQFCLLSLQ
jgi:hypothetical protein